MCLIHEGWKKKTVVVVVFFLVAAAFFFGAAGFLAVVDFFLVAVFFLGAAFFFGAAFGFFVNAFFASGESLYDALTLTKSPSVTPFLRAALITCFLISFCIYK